MFKNLFKKNIDALDKFRTTNDVLITYEELSKFPLNQVIQIVPDLEGAIECIRITSNDPNTLMFTVTMKKNQLWEKHHHDCQEKCVVFKGKLKDIINNKTASSAELLKYNPFESHYIVAEKDTIFYVEFIKPDK